MGVKPLQHEKGFEVGLQHHEKERRKRGEVREEGGECLAFTIAIGIIPRKSSNNILSNKVIYMLIYNISYM